MDGRIRWSHGVIALALIAALAIAAPAIGGPSLKKLVKKEVAKQIAKATGSQGPPGANGTNGIDGAPGAARAYARVIPHSTTPCAPQCTFDRSQGVASVTRTGTGTFCISAPGLNASTTAAAVTLDREHTANPDGNASADYVLCGGGLFGVATERQPSTAVRNATDDGTVNVAGNAVAADDVGFTIVIP